MKNFSKVLFFIYLTIHVTTAYSQNFVSGKIVNPNTSTVVVGATVVLNGTSIGTTTDTSGYFKLVNNRPLPWELVVSAVGYQTQTVTVKQTSTSLVIRLAEANQLLSEVVVSASRKAEKVHNAPASVSVLSA